jgi:hypothetical protein
MLGLRLRAGTNVMYPPSLPYVIELPHAPLNFVTAPRNRLDRDGERADVYRTAIWGHCSTGISLGATPRIPRD